MSTLQIVYLFLAGGVILFWIIIAIRGPRKIDGPDIVAVLRYGRLLRIGALICALAPPTLMSFAVGTFVWRNETALAIAGGSFLLASLIAGLLLLEAEKVQIVLTEDSITRYSPWTGQVTLKWNEIDRIRYSVINRWFVVTGMGRTICVSRHLAGMPVFAEMVKRKLAAERFASAAATFDGITKS